MLTIWWIVLALLFPVVGVVVSIIGIIQNKKDAVTLLLISIGAWILWGTALIRFI